jgi:hypothetical protein
MKNYCKKYYRTRPGHPARTRPNVADAPSTPSPASAATQSPGQAQPKPVIKKKFDINTWDPHLADQYLNNY